MTGQNVRRAFIVFHVTLAIVVLVQSVVTLVHAVHSPMEGHIGMVLPWFAGLEALAALLLLIPKTLKIGGWLLIVIFLAAIAYHGPLYEAPLFVYLAGVIFIMIHGAAYQPEEESDSADSV